MWKINKTIPTKINDLYRLNYILNAKGMNAKGIPDNIILASFNTVNMFPSIDNSGGVPAVKSALDSRINLSTSTECIIEALEITNNNSPFTGQNLIQTNGTAMEAANFCSYSDLVIQNLVR